MPQPSVEAVDLELDVQALRHLVTRREIANVLWSGEVRVGLQNALRHLHGGSNFDHLERVVSEQLLLTRMKVLPSLLENLFQGSDDEKAQQILGIVAEIIRANTEDADSIQFREDFVLLLLQALLQASLQIIMKADLDDIKAKYRSTIDLIREMFESCEEFDSAHALKKTGIKLVKDVVMALARSNRKDALFKAKKFLQKYGNERTARDLQGQADVLEKLLKPIAIREYYANSVALAHDTAHRRQKRGRKKHLTSDDVPDFFSDRSDETSNVTPDYDSPRDEAEAVETVRANLGEEHASDMSSPTSTDTPKPPKKRSRMSRADFQVDDAVMVENGDVRDRSETPVSRTRGKRYPDISEELNGMTSPMFSETRPAPESINHVARHARSRGHARRLRPKEHRKKLLTSGRSPTSISQEGSSPTHRGKKAREPGAQSGEEGHARRGIDKDDEDAMGRMGREGKVLQDLHTKATKLQEAGPADPLPDAIRDARQAKRRRPGKDPSYSPGPDAREASPFPDSEEESDLQRKTVSRLRLAETPTGRRSKQQARKPSEAKPAMYIFGKQCRTGRFEPAEDKWLLKGLKALGWGAWTEIAREFWEGEFARAPSSLKDRARTLNLGPQSYPRMIELRGRRRHADNPVGAGASPLQRRRRHSGNPDDNDNDQDEDEEDPIEAPNGTPGSGEEVDADADAEADGEAEAKAVVDADAEAVGEAEAKAVEE